MDEFAAPKASPSPKAVKKQEESIKLIDRQFAQNLAISMASGLSYTISRLGLRSISAVR